MMPYYILFKLLLIVNLLIFIVSVPVLNKVSGASCLTNNEASCLMQDAAMRQLLSPMHIQLDFLHCGSPALAKRA